MLLGESVWRRTYVPAVPDDSFPSTSAVAVKDRATPRPRYHVLAVYAQANLLQIRPGIGLQAVSCGGWARRVGTCDDRSHPARPLRTLGRGAPPNVECDHHGMNEATLTRRVCSRAAAVLSPWAVRSDSPAAHSFRSAAVS